MDFVLLFFVIICKQGITSVKGSPEMLSDISNGSNCTIIIVNISQYCFVDNDTIRISQDNELISASYNGDHYITASNQTYVILLLYNDTTEPVYCAATDDLNVAAQVCRLGIILISVVLCSLLGLYLLHRKLYNILQFKLLLAGDIFYLLTLVFMFVYVLTEFTIQVHSVVCLTLFYAVRSLSRCALTIQTAIVIVTCHSFYRCYKLKPTFSNSHKVKIFWWCLIGSLIYGGVITVAVASFDLILQYDYSTVNGYCIAYDEKSRQQTVSSRIYTAFGVITIVICFVTLIINIIFFRFLTKRNTSHITTDINKRLFKLTVVLICTLGMSSLVFYTVQYISVEHSQLISGLILFSFERIILLYISYNTRLPISEQV